MKWVLYIVALISTTILNVSVVRAQTWRADGGIEDVEQVKVEALNLPNMPLKIEAATPAHYGERFAVKYSVTNSTDKSISRFKGIFFVFDINGELLDVEDYPLREEIAAHATNTWAYLLRRAANVGDRVVMALEEVAGEDGIWRVEKQRLEANVKARVSGQSNKLLQAQHEINMALTDEDRKEIIRLALEEAIIKKPMSNLGFWDKQRREASKKALDVYLLKENIDDEIVPQLPGVNLILLDKNGIQEKADSEDSIVYLSFSKFKSQGSNVVVSLNIHLAQSNLSGGQRILGWGAGRTIEYHKEAGRWVGQVITYWTV